MKLDRVKEIAAAVLYEGYILYPYRASSIKNRQRWTFGGVFPADYASFEGGDPSSMQTQCLLRGTPRSIVEVRVRFLHLLPREIGQLHDPVAELARDAVPTFTKVPAMDIDGIKFVSWEEAIEREVEAPPLAVGNLAGTPARIDFAFPGKTHLDPIRMEGGRITAVWVRTALSIEGTIGISAESVATDVWRLTVRVENLTPLPAAERENREQAQRRALASTHTIFAVRDGAFVSLLDPPDDLREAAAQCDNQGTWPVLAGEEGTTDNLLSSPIILYDYPQIAPESPGDLFDSTEIDEILILRILAMTDDEKREMAAGDERARALLERTEALTPAELCKLHGVMRNPRATAATTRDPWAAREANSRPAAHATNAARLNVGDRVRLQPKAGGDIMDIALKDKVAIVEAIETDFEDRVHVAVTLIDDPGRDLGLGRYPGHRFFFSPDEVERCGDGVGS
ncbi:MAG: hypothetical protein WCC90_17230 [Methylocella sp.]